MALFEIHQRFKGHFLNNLRVLFPFNNVNTEFMWSYFVFKNITYNKRNGPLLGLPAAKSTSYGHKFSVSQSTSTLQQFPTIC